MSVGEPEPLLLLSEACRLLRVSVAATRNRLGDPAFRTRIGAVKVFGRWKCRPEVVRQLMERGEPEAAPAQRTSAMLRRVDYPHLAGRGQR